MGILSILHFGGAAVSEGAEAVTQSVASHFPTTWSRAAHDELIHSQDQLRVQVVEAKSRVTAAEQKVTADKDTIAQLDEQLANNYSKVAFEAASDADKPDIKAMAVKLRAKHTELDSLLAHDSEALDSAMAHMTQVQNAYDSFSVRIEEFAKQEQETQDHLQDAKNREQQAQLELDSSAKLNALTSSVGSLTTVMSGINAAAAAAEQRAQIAEMKVKEAHDRAGTSVDDLLAAAKAGKPKSASVDPWA